MTPCITLSNVFFEYPYRRSLASLLFSSRRISTPRSTLSAINLTINHGERVALLGQNGSGKTTLLRIISSIIEPNSGTSFTSAPVFPLLQQGFFSTRELTVAQTVRTYYLYNKNYYTLGYNDYLQSILDFSGLHEHVDKPVKKLSQGMSLRLLFSILVDGQHNILAIDEFFGTGDAAFFQKAQQRLTKFLQDSSTLILASHSDNLLRDFCTRGIVMRSGSIAFDGPLSDALKFYRDLQ